MKDYKCKRCNDTFQCKEMEQFSYCEECERDIQKIRGVIPK